MSTLSRRSIEVPGLEHGGLPIPGASRVGPWVATGAIRGVNRRTGLMSENVQEQVGCMFENLRTILSAAGASCEGVLRLTLWIKTEDARAAINSEWLRMFPHPHSRPARHILRYELRGGMLVQCEALAVVGVEQRIGGRMSDAGDAVIKRLAQLDACAISDALDRVAHSGVAHGLTALSAPRRIVGRAVTVRLGLDPNSTSKRHLCTAAIEAAGPHNVIVIANGGRTDVAGWGGTMSLAATSKHIAGVVIDGACRDLDESRELDLPIYARGGTTVTARGRIVELDWNVPVEISGVRVAPDDLVIADASGVVFIPQDQAEKVLGVAEAIVAKERLMAQAVRRGDPISQVMGADYENMLKDSL